MRISEICRAASGVLLAAILLPAQPANAANYPLEITAPRANLPATHRMLRAYPGFTYNIRAAVVGGLYPFTYSLTNAPAGMSINSRTGEINWVNPTSNATPTLVVRDAEGTQATQTWSITVTTSNFKFVDAINGSSSGTGAIGSPWRTLLDVHSRSVGADIVYFRTGVYDTVGIPTVNSSLELRVEFDQDRQAVKWLAYPGESPIIDHRYAGSPTPRIRITGDSIYVDGFEVRNIYVMGFQVDHEGRQGSIFRRNNMHHLMVGGDGTNSAFIMTVSSFQNRDYGMVVQDNEFHHLSGVGTTLKFYSQEKLLVENNTHHDTSGAANELKSDLGQFTVRGDLYYNMSYNAIGGNQAHDNISAAAGSYGEICFNNVLDGGSLGALRINQNGEALRIHIYRNTFQGRVQVQNTDSADGPFYFYNNVIINNDSGTPAGSHITHSGVSDPSRIILTNNLVGYPTNNIVDANGELTAAYNTYRATHGHNTGSPRPPTNVRIIR